MKNLRLRKFLKTKKMFVGLLASYVVIFIFMTTFLFWMYAESDAKVKENLTEYNDTCVKHIGETFDIFCSDLESTSYQMGFMPLIDSAMRGTDDAVAYSDYETFSSYIGKLRVKYDFIVEAYLYRVEDDTMYSTSALVDSKTYFNNIYRYKNLDFSEWKKTYLTGVNSNRLFPVEVVDQYGLIETNVVTYSHSYLKKGTHQVAAYFNVLIDIDKMLASIDEIQILNGFGTFAVYDQNNDMIFESGEPLPEKELIEERLKKDERPVEVDNRSIFYVSSNFRPWTYLIVTDGGSFLNEMSDFTRKLQIIILFNLIVGILMVILSVIYTYRPLRKIIADITRNNANDMINEIGEVELLKTIFSEQEKTILKIEGIVMKQKELIKKNALKKILFAQANGDENDERESISNELIGFNDEMYGVAVLLVPEDENYEYKNEIHLIEYALSNMFQDALSDNYNINIVSFKQGRLALVVNLSRDKVDSWFKDLQFIGEYINTLMVSEYEVELFIGVGGVYESSKDISKSFTEALSALNFRPGSNDAHITVYKELLEKEKQSGYYYYPVDANSEITGAVIVGDYNRVKHILEDIEKTNEKLEIDEQAKYQLNQNITEFYQSLAVAYAAEPGFFADDIIKESTSELIRIIKKQYRALCGGAEMATSDKSEKLIGSIRDYVRENFAENGLSLNMISDHFGITRQYLSTLYRSVTGEKLVDFITRVRIEKAKELLNDRSLSINQIAVQVGFTNDISLIRAFKRVEGVTPGYYRDNL